ncbi:hypothetical protein pb186bvf_015994 [Paramecium bursaria]
MKKFMRLSKIAQLQAESKSRLADLQNQFTRLQVIIRYFRGTIRNSYKIAQKFDIRQGFSRVHQVDGFIETHGDVDIIAREESDRQDFPQLYSNEPQKFSQTTRIFIEQIENIQDIQKCADQAVDMLKDDLSSELEILLQDVKGNTLEDKLQKSLTYTEQNFKKIVKQDSLGK